MKKRMLILEDGTIFEGVAFGSDEASIGETVFTTGMTGYQETISNPSNCGQIIVMTYPLIGNYGINRDDFESIESAMNGIVVRELEDEPSNFRNDMTLREWLTQKNIPGIQGIDTRKLTRLLREKGPLKGKLTAANEDIINVEETVEEVKNTELPTDLVKKVSTKRPYPSPGRGKRVVVIDYGMKHGILRELNKRDCDVIVVPYNTKTDEINSLFPDGIVLTNGPGNPTHVEGAFETIQGLVGKAPIFGIGLGHQLLALSLGAKVNKLSSGHRGSNIPVKDLKTGRTELTAQNHGYAVEKDSLEGTSLKVTHIALNDQSIEGLESTEEEIFSVQFYPEASPGPEDANHLFDRFMELMNSHNRKEQVNA